MPGGLNLASLELRIDESGVVTGTARAGASFDRLKAKGEGTASGLKSAFAGLAAYLSARTFLAAFDAVASATREAELAQVRLAGVLRATGNASGFTAQQLNELATTMSRNTLFDDEEIKNAAARLATFGNVVGVVFDRALRLSADLATLTGDDLSGAARSLGRALEDPIRGMQLLTRQGIALSEAERAAVRDAIRHGDVRRAQTAILDALQAKVGGLAGGAHTGLTGAIHDLRVEWGNFLETFGQTPGMAQTVANAIALVADAMQGLILTIQPTMAMMEEAKRASRDRRVAEFQRLSEQGPATGAGETEAQWRAALRRRADEINKLTSDIDRLRAASVQAMAQAGAASAAAAARTLRAVTDGTTAEKKLSDAHRRAMDQFNDLLGAQQQSLREQRETWQETANANVAATQKQIDAQRDLEASMTKVIDVTEKLRNAQAQGAPWKDGGDSLTSLQNYLSSVTTILGGDLLGGVAGLGLTGPIGFAIGAFSTLADMLLGSSEAAEQAAAAERALRQARQEFVRGLGQFGYEIESTRVQTGVTSRGQAIFGWEVALRALAGLDRELVASASQFEVLRERARELYGTTVELSRRLAELDALEQAEADRLRREFADRRREAAEDLELRALIAQGRNEEADAFALALEQQREYEQAVRDGADATYLARLREVHGMEAVQRAADVLRGQIASLTGTIDALRGFGASLRLDASVSPTARYAEARRQYEAVLQQAMTGDQAAAGRLPEVARTFLDASRMMFASGVAYQRDFAAVQEAIDTVATMFEAQRTEAQQQLDALLGIETGLTEYIGPIMNTQTDVLVAGFTELTTVQRETIDELRGLRDEFRRSFASVNLN